MAKAKAEFLRHYERTAQLLNVFDSEEDSEEDSESSEEDSDDESESDEDSSSSEEGEDSDEDEEEEEEDEDEEEEEDKGQEENDDDEEGVRGQGYNKRGREEEEEEEDKEDGRIGETRILFEKILPAQLNIPFNSAQRTAKLITFDPAFLHQSRFNSNSQLASPGQNLFP